jgi:hypothetical protein
VSLLRRWYSDAEPEEVRWWLGRGDALARGMRQASARDRLAPGNTWRPGPAPAPRQALKQERARQQSDPATDTGRARTLARATEQNRRRTRRPR